MSLPPALQPADEIWSDLRRHLEWSHGFSLFFLFGRPRGTALIRDRLVDTLRLRSLTLQQVIPSDADAAPEQVISAVLNASDPLNAIGALLWVELDRSPDDPIWNHARSWVLTALNERRYLLERDVRRPVIFVLPLGYRRIALEIAPDLWQVRTFSADVGEAADAAGGAYHAPDRREQQIVPVITLAERADGPPVSVREWGRIKGSDPARVALAQGWVAASDAERLGDLSLAQRIAREVVDIARLRQQRGTPRPGVADRELSASLERMGDVAGKLGRWKEAEGAYREGLELARKILAAGGETPEALRDVSVSLNKVGDVARELGRLEEAQRAYWEGLELARKILAVGSETPGALRDVSVSLNKVGDVARELGRLEEAERAYREGLELRRKILAAGEETPGALRDVSVSLERVGDVAQELGRLEEAERAYREGLELRRKILAAGEETPGALRDVSASLNKIGDVARELGRLEEAERAYREGLELARKILRAGGETPGALRDVSVSLSNVGDVARELGRLEEAERAYREGLELARKILAVGERDAGGAARRERVAEQRRRGGAGTRAAGGGGARVPGGAGASAEDSRGGRGDAGGAARRERVAEQGRRRGARAGTAGGGRAGVPGTRPHLSCASRAAWRFPPSPR